MPGVGWPWIPSTSRPTGGSRTAIPPPEPAGSSAFTLLTEREREVLQLLAEGHSTREIAEQLYMSPKTVATHREHLMEKLHIRSIAGLTKYAILEGLTSKEPDYTP